MSEYMQAFGLFSIYLFIFHIKQLVRLGFYLLLCRLSSKIQFDVLRPNTGNLYLKCKSQFLLKISKSAYMKAFSAVVLLCFVYLSIKDSYISKGFNLKMHF